MLLFHTAFAPGEKKQVEDKNLLIVRQKVAITLVNQDTNLNENDKKERIAAIKKENDVQGLENLMKKWGYYDLYVKELQRIQELQKTQKGSSAAISIQKSQKMAETGNTTNKLAQNDKETVNKMNDPLDKSNNGFWTKPGEGGTA